MSKFTPQFLDEIRARTTLSTLVGQATKLQRAGREWRACCPFHDEKTPSFYVNDDKGFYHCFGCSAHGDAIRWLTDQRGLAFVDAVKELADSAGLALPAPDPRAEERASRAASLHDVMAAASAWFAEQLQNDTGFQARAYLKQRGLGATTVETFGIGFAPDRRDALKAALTRFGDDMLVEAGLLIKVDDKPPYDRFRGRLMIPIRDPRGRVIAFGGRIIGEGEPKYLNSPETPLFDKGRTLYNLDRAAPAARKAERLIVVEGYLDVIALAQVGIDEVVAPLGTALTEAQLERLWRVVDVPVLCFDGDGAGRKAAVRAAERALPILVTPRSLQIAILPDGQDPDDIARNEGISVFEAIVAKSSPLDEFLWAAALEQTRLDTPEKRSQFGKLLRALAGQIKDEDLRVLYLASFNARIDELFEKKEDTGGWGTPYQRAKRKRGINPVTASIAEYGLVAVTFAPSAIRGLLRYPDLIGHYAELLAHFHALLYRRDFKLVLEEMLNAALTTYPLERDRLLTILLEAGMAPGLKTLLGRMPLPYSFLNDNSGVTEARNDLSALLEQLSALPEVQAALAEATRRLEKVDGNDADFFDQQRLSAEVARLMEQLMRSYVESQDFEVV